MFKRLVFLIILVFTLSSCATVEYGGVPKRTVLSAEEEAALKKVAEWEDYMSLIRNGDFSISIVLRLTDEYFQAKDVLFKKEMEEYERQFSLYSSGKIKAEPKRPLQDHSRLIEEFRVLSETYRYEEWADSIRYGLGFALLEHGDYAEAVKVFEDILKNYPNSDYSSEVSFRLGEYYFETGQIGEAEEMYKKILSRPLSSFYEKGIYKLGWINYKLDSFERAIDMFMAMVDRRWEGSAAESGQTQEGINCIVMSMSAMKNTSKALAYLESKGLRGYTPAVLLNYGERLMDETRYNEAILVYKYFSEKLKDDPLAPSVYDRLADLYERTGDVKESLLKRWELAEQFNSSTQWYFNNFPNGSEKINSLVSSALLYTSKRYHFLGKKGEAESLEKAMTGYKLFLTSFPNAPETKEVTLLLAEALFDGKRFAEAAVEYESAAKMHKDSPAVPDLVYSSFLSYEMVFQADKKEDHVKAAEKLLETYKDLLARNPKLAKARMRVAEMYGELELYPGARSALVPLLKLNESAAAQRMTAEFFIKEKNFASAEEMYSKLAEDKGPAEVKERLAQVRFVMAEGLYKNGKAKEAADKFNQAFFTHQGSTVSEAALIKLGHIYLGLKEYGNLETSADRLLKSFPNSEITAAFLIEAANGVREVRPLLAAKLYESSSVITKDPKEQSALLIASGSLYEENGELVKAEAIFRKYLEKKDIPVAEEAGLLLKVGQIQTRAKKKEAKETLGKVVSMRGLIDDGIIARASLLLLWDREREYIDMRLAQPFEETFKKKTDALNALTVNYTEIAKSKVPDIIPEVYYRMGTLFENFRDSIIKSERPGGFSSEQAEEYNFLLEEKAYPYDEQAVKVYERCTDSARKLSVFTEWTDKCFTRLSELRPAVYKRPFEEKWSAPVFIKPEPVKIELGR